MDRRSFLKASGAALSAVAAAPILRLLPVPEPVPAPPLYANVWMRHTGGVVRVLVKGEPRVGDMLSVDGQNLEAFVVDVSADTPPVVQEGDTVSINLSLHDQ